MAVMQNSIIFGGVDSADFGIYIGGEGTFNAPKRDVEMISIPGRNGAFALDKGRFENIEVTYSAFNYEKDLATFARQLSDFRNAICSQKGYQRLTDTFHLEEYRMATYLDGLEIKPVDFNTAATFDIVFNCKPQRYLLSGEEAIDVTSGDTILNPTHFESKPMLEVEGYGTIGFNGFEIELTNKVLGNVELVRRGSTQLVSVTKTFSKAQFNKGDTITVSDETGESGVKILNVGLYQFVYSPTARYLATFTNSNNAFDTVVRTSPSSETRYVPYYDIWSSPLTFVAGTASTVTNKTTFKVKNYDTSPISDFGTVYVDVEIEYIPKYSTDLSAIEINVYFSCSDESKVYANSNAIGWGNVTVDSTLSLLGHPTYIDCDLGEAYLIRDNTPVSLNRYIDLGSELPTFAVGNNEITYDNTITDLKVVPRWWIV